MGDVVSIISYVVDVVLQLLRQIGHIIGILKITKQKKDLYLKRIMFQRRLKVRIGSRNSSLVIITPIKFLKEKRLHKKNLMILLQIKLETNFLLPIFKESKQMSLSFKFRKPMKKFHKSRKNLSKPRRRKIKKCNKQLARRNTRLSRLKSRSRKNW